MASNLPNECKDLIPFLTQKTTGQMTSPKTEFCKWIKVAKEYAEDKNRLHEFSEEKLSIVNKKALYLNGANVKDDKTAET